MTGDQLFHAPAQLRSTDERFTPAWVFDGLGLTFDLDPASPLHHDTAVPAVQKLTINDDGLTAPWHGLVWLNPPYSQSTAWVDRFITHANGIFLGPYANSAWFHQLSSASDLFVVSRDFKFIHPTHTGRHVSMALVFSAIGETATKGLKRLVQSRPNMLVPFIHPDWYQTRPS